MFQSKSVTIFELSQIIFYFNKSFGLYPFSLNISHHKVTVKIRDVLYTLLIFVPLAIILWYRFVHAFPSTTNSSFEVFRVGRSFVIYYGFIIVAGSVFANLLNHRNFLRILENFEKFDNKVGVEITLTQSSPSLEILTRHCFLSDHPTPYVNQSLSTFPLRPLCHFSLCMFNAGRRSYFGFNLHFLEIACATLWPDCYCSLDNFPDNSRDIILLGGSCASNQIWDYQPTDDVSRWTENSVSSKFISFRKNFKTEIDDNEILNDDAFSADLLAALASLHDLLCDTVSLINLSFSLTIAGFIGLILISFIFSLFGFYAALYTQALHQDRIGYSLSVNFWNFYLFCFVFGSVCVSSFSTGEAKSTSILLHKALNYQESKMVQRRVFKSR